MESRSLIRLPRPGLCVELVDGGLAGGGRADQLRYVAEEKRFEALEARLVQGGSSLGYAPEILRAVPVGL